MAKIAVILVLVGLTVMTSAYSLRRPHFNQELYTENENERAQLIKQLKALSADLPMEDNVGDVQAISCPEPCQPCRGPCLPCRGTCCFCFYAYPYGSSCHDCPISDENIILS
jgi:hypothetical protein